MPEPESKSMPEVANELWGLTKDYARQETIDPLKGVGRYLAYGAAGALLGSLGVILLMLSLLRALQTETGDTFRRQLVVGPVPDRAGRRRRGRRLRVLARLPRPRQVNR